MIELRPLRRPVRRARGSPHAKHVIGAHTHMARVATKSNNAYCVCDLCEFIRKPANATGRL